MKITHLNFVNIPQNQYEKNTREIDLQDFLNTVKNPPSDLEKKINEIRNEQDKNKRKELKNTLPAVTISANFPDRRTSKSAQILTGLAQIDIDDCNDPQTVKQTLCNDPHILACFFSPSGNGVKGIVRIEPNATDADGQLAKLNEHKSLYANVTRYYKKQYNFDLDSACSDISRAMFYSFDPEIYINYDATNLQKIETHYDAMNLQEIKTNKTPKKTAKKQRNTRDVLRIVEKIEHSGDALNYQERLNAGMSFANAFGEEGRNFFHRISRNHENYDAEKFNAKYDDFLKNTRGEITLGSFFHFAKEKGFYFDNNDELVNAIQELKIRHNVVTNEYEIPMQESLFPDNKNWIYQTLTDKMENTIYVQLKSNGHKLNIHEMRTLIHSDLSQSYNPFTDYLDTIRHLQNPDTPALNQLLSALPVKDARILFFVRKWLISIISAMHGIPSDILLVFCGGQGTGKTVFFETLLPPVLRKYYAESSHEGNKDDLILMCRTLLLLDDEYHGRSKRESEKIKAILSQKEFTLRASYARNHETRKRYAVFCGTSNISEIKFDITGNRRIIPVDIIGQIDRTLYTSKEYSGHDFPDRNQLFADLFYLYNQDPNQWRINGNDAILLNEITSENEAYSNEQDLISRCFFANGHDGEKWKSISEIIQHIEQQTGARIDTQMRNKFSMVLRKLGYVKSRKREEHSNRTDSAVWGYVIAPRFLV